MIYFCLLVLCFVLPVHLDTKYDVIVIPIAKTPVLIKNIIQLPNSLRNTKKSRNENYIRIDIENYEEPTDVPDPDNFDYMKDRDYKDKEYKDKDYKDKDYRDKDYKDKDYKDKEYKDKDKDYTKDRDYIKDREEREGEDESNYGDDKIVGGREVDINLYPYHVAYGSNCGGAILDPKWIITAGHCGKKPYIKVGSKYMNQGAKVNVKRSVIHPNWGAKNKEHPFDYDFQLLEVAEPLKFNENVQAIKIAHIEDMVIGKVISVTGWGNTEENGPYSSVLRAVRVPIISKENCQNVPFPYFRGSLTSRMFCAGFPEGQKDACQGDSGGPAVAYDRLLGMVSFGYGCATPGSYGVYSKVAKVRSWIEQVTGLKLD